MLYKIKAKIYKNRMESFFKALSDGTIAAQKPDGSYIVKAMQEALMTDDKTLSWYEACYCVTPLRHERKTVYDHYLYDFEITSVYEIKEDIEGKLFWDYLENNHYEGTYTY